jgi:CRISPR/Cas system-associated exonuclease Cas4 (RecB family)
MQLQRPKAAVVKQLSPSGYEVLRSCPMHFAFSSEPRPSSRRMWAAGALLGQMVHDVMRLMVTSGAIFRPNWEEISASFWTSQAAQIAQKYPQKDIDTWPGYQLKRALLKYFVGSLRELLRALPADSEMLAEQQLRSTDGILWGRPDLIIRSAETVCLVDYKTGKTGGSEDMSSRSLFERQLQMYAYLEHEETGRWPDRADLLLLEGKAVEVSVRSGDCERLARDAKERLAAYNALASGPPVSVPSPKNCLYCPFSVSCPDFWAACDTSWADAGLLAAAGQATRVFDTPLGGVTVQLVSEVGSLAGKLVTIEGLDRAQLQRLGQPVVGSLIRVSGLRQGRHAGCHQAREWTYFVSGLGGVT